MLSFLLLLLVSTTAHAETCGDAPVPFTRLMTPATAAELTACDVVTRVRLVSIGVPPQGAMQVTPTDAGPDDVLILVVPEGWPLDHALLSARVVSMPRTAAAPVFALRPGDPLVIMGRPVVRDRGGAGGKMHEVLFKATGALTPQGDLDLDGVSTRSVLALPRIAATAGRPVPRSGVELSSVLATIEAMVRDGAPVSRIAVAAQRGGSEGTLADSIQRGMRLPADARPARRDDPLMDEDVSFDE